MTMIPDLSGTAALAICESLLLALNDRDILPELEVVEVLQHAAAALLTNARQDGRAEVHLAAAALIKSIIVGGNSVRRT